MIILAEFAAAQNCQPINKNQYKNASMHKNTPIANVAFTCKTNTFQWKPMRIYEEQ
jgi:hypothetical protein